MPFLNQEVPLNIGFKYLHICSTSALKLQGLGRNVTLTLDISPTATTIEA